MLAKTTYPRLWKSLIQKSLLYRTQDTKDRRKIHLSLAEKKNLLHREVERVRERFREQVFQGFRRKKKARCSI